MTMKHFDLKLREVTDIALTQSGSAHGGTTTDKLQKCDRCVLHFDREFGPTRRIVSQRARAPHRQHRPTLVASALGPQVPASIIQGDRQVGTSARQVTDPAHWR